MRNFINFQLPPESADFEISERKIESSDDCNTIQYISAVLKFSNSDYLQLLKSSEMKYDVPLELPEENLKQWFPLNVKKRFTKSEDGYVTLNPEIFDGKDFVKIKEKSEALLIFTGDNTVLIILTKCKLKVKHF